MFRKNKGKPGEVAVTDEDAEIIDDVLTPYWAGKDYATNFFRSLPEDTRFMLDGPRSEEHHHGTLRVACDFAHATFAELDARFLKILTRGVKGIREEANRQTGCAVTSRRISSTKSRSSTLSSSPATP